MSFCRPRQLKLTLQILKEEVKEFKKMKVTIQDMDKRKAIADLMKQNLSVSVNGGVIKVDGKVKTLITMQKI